MRDIFLYYWLFYDFIFIFTKWFGEERECQSVNIKKILLFHLKKYLDVCISQKNIYYKKYIACISFRDTLLKGNTLLLKLLFETFLKILCWYMIFESSDAFSSVYIHLWMHNRRVEENEYCGIKSPSGERHSAFYSKLFASSAFQWFQRDFCCSVWSVSFCTRVFIGHAARCSFTVGILPLSHSTKHRRYRCLKKIIVGRYSPERSSLITSSWRFTASSLNDVMIIKWTPRRSGDIRVSEKLIRS